MLLSGCGRLVTTGGVSCMHHPGGRWLGGFESTGGVSVILILVVLCDQGRLRFWWDGRLFGCRFAWGLVFH